MKDLDTAVRRWRGQDFLHSSARIRSPGNRAGKAVHRSKLTYANNLHYSRMSRGFAHGTRQALKKVHVHVPDGSDREFEPVHSVPARAHCPKGQVVCEDSDGTVDMLKHSPKGCYEATAAFGETRGRRRSHWADVA